jgi:cAMP phosphodiesterase
MAVSHGTNESGTYNSAAFFLRHDPSQKECLFWGDVEPDSIASKPANIFVWREAAPKIVAGKLDSVFIECSWPSGRSDETLFGHLTPEHLTQELRVLATEVYAVTHSTVDYGNGQVRRSSRRPSIPALLARKGKRETSVAPLEKTRGVLEGVKIFVIHCKDDLEEKFSEPINQVIAGQIRALVDQAGLGCEIIAVEQGTRICMSFSFL